MKFITILMGLLLLVSCSGEKAQSYALLSGKIKNANGKILNVRGNRFAQKITLNEDGFFADTLKVKTGYYSFNDGKESGSIYLEPGFELTLNIDAKSFDESIHFIGKGAEENNYLAKKFLIIEQQMGDTPQFYSQSEEEFLSKLLILQKMLEKLLYENKKFTKHFTVLEKKSLRYHFMSTIQKFPDYHAYFTHNKDYKVSDKFLDPVRKLDFENESDYENFDSYRSLVRNHYLEPMEKDDDVELTINNLKKSKSNLIKNDIARGLYYRLSPSFKELDVLYNGLMEISNDSTFRARLGLKYEKIKNLVPGKVSPKFTYKDVNGKTVNLDDLKGKYVYIDVWATWCGPCLREIPSLKTLEKKYSRRNIAFVSISVDKEKDISTWKKMVKDKELKGIQLHADNNWKADFVTAYGIESIPRFILLDKKGKIINADAPRPSDPKLISDYFDKLNRL